MKIFCLLMICACFISSVSACECMEEHEDYANWIRNHLIHEVK